MALLNIKKSEYFSDLFVEYLERFYNSSDLSEDSFRTYVSRLRPLCDTLEKDFLEITETDARLYFDKLLNKCIEGECKRSSVYSKQACYSRIAEYIQVVIGHKGFVNPFRNIMIEAPAPDLQVKRIPTASDVDNILSAAPDKMYYVIFTLAFRTALPLNDIVTLKKTNISVSNGVVVIYLHKGKKERLIPLPEDVVFLLQDYIDSMEYIDEQGHLFYNKYKNVLNGWNIHYCFQQIVSKLGFDSTYSIKDLRNRCILDMISASAKEGLDADIVGDYVGLGDLRMRTFTKAASMIKKSPADLVNIRVNPYNNADSFEE